jgi:hypothetical protein
MFVDLLPNSPTAERQSHLDSLARYTVALSDFVCPEPENLDFEVADSGARGQAGHRSDEAFLQALRIQKLVRLRCLAPGYPRRLGRQRSTCRAGAVAHFVEDGTFFVSNEVPGEPVPVLVAGRNKPGQHLMCDIFGFVRIGHDAICARDERVADPGPRRRSGR